jgi:hypothetical protein
MQDFAQELDGLHRQVEEWGTVTMSAFILTPPERIQNTVTVVKTADGKETTTKETKVVGTFHFGLQKTADDYFNLAGQAEGTARNAVRISQQFAGAVSGLFLPDEALRIGNERKQFLQQQKIANEIQFDKLDVFRKNIARREENQHFVVEAAQSKVDDARARVTRAESAQRLIGIEATRADSTLAAAKREQLEATRKQQDLVAANKKDLENLTAKTTVGTDAQKEAAKAALEAAKIKHAQEEDAAGAVKLGADRKVEDAQAEATPAAARLAAAQKEVSDSRAARDTAETNLNTALNSDLGLPKFDPNATDPAGNPPAQTAITTFPGVVPATQDANALFSGLGDAKAFANALPKPADSKAALGDIAADALVQTLQSADPHAPNTANFPTRARVVDAASNKAIQEIFNFLGDPAASTQFVDKKLIFGVANVSVTPGWRTKRDYAAQLDVKASYRWAGAHAETVRRMIHSSVYPYKVRKWIADSYPSCLKREDRELLAEEAATLPKAETALGKITDDLWGYVVPGLPLITHDNPLVAAVSPLMDTQNLDETGSFAQQTDLALFLSLSMARAGLRGQAEAYERYIKQRRHDVATRTSAAVANSYSAGGGFFGFQIGTRLKALDNPASRKSVPAQTLERQSFPVLILFGIAADDLTPVMTLEDGTLSIHERQLVTRYTTRWLRTDHSFWQPWKNKRQNLPSFALERKANLEEVLAQYPEELNEEGGVIPAKGATLSLARANYEVLQSAYFGANNRQRLPSSYLIPDDVMEPRKTVAKPVSLGLQDILPILERITAVESTSGDGRAATSPFVIRGEGTGEPTSGTVSLLLEGKRLDQIDLAHLDKVSETAALAGTPRFIGKDAIMVTLKLAAKQGNLTLRLPITISPENQDLIKLFPQTVSPTLFYSLVK